MAPNRKSLELLTNGLSEQDLATLQTGFQAKFVPVTQQEETPAETADDCSSSYWEWSTDTEHVECILSTENLVSNLIQVQEPAESETVLIQKNDDYWAEGERPSTPERSYWDWPTDEETYASRNYPRTPFATTTVASSDDYWAW